MGCRGRRVNLSILFLSLKVITLEIITSLIIFCSTENGYKGTVMELQLAIFLSNTPWPFAHTTAVTLFLTGYLLI